jgi:hypothetical protein
MLAAPKNWPLAEEGYWLFGELLPKWWEATTQMVGSYSIRGAKLLYKRWEV